MATEKKEMVPLKFCKVRLGDRYAEFLCRDARVGFIQREVIDIPNYEIFCEELGKAIKRKRDEGWEVYVEPC
jgi:hypothetical protein